MSAIEHFRLQKDEFFRTDAHSPLTPEQKAGFQGLDYFPHNPDLDIVVDVEVFPESDEIQIPTNTGSVQAFERYGRFTFQVEGQEAALTIYRNEHGFFLPFADALFGQETYGAGRYLEPEENPDGRFHVDFNLAYNPYCAYNDAWSCPLTPWENRLKVPIRAGEKVFD
jgi:hypothetical protein